MKKEEFENFNIERVISNLSEKRKFFTSEADFQLEMAWIIKKMYKCRVRMEYYYEFKNLDQNKWKPVYIDILVMNKKRNTWIPIELKYKTKKCNIAENEKENCVLKDQGAQDQGRYRYLKDIERIEAIKTDLEKKGVGQKFFKGYTVFLTNDISYAKKRVNTVDKDFSLGDTRIKKRKIKMGFKCK